MIQNVMHSFVLNITACLVLLLAALIAAPVVDAQTLLDVGAANSIRADLESGNTGRDRGDSEEEAEEPEAEETEETSDEEASSEASGEEETATVKIDKWDDQHSIYRTPRPSFTWWKLLIYLLIFFCWVRTCDWINRYARIFKLSHNKWALLTVLPFSIFPALFLVNFFICAAVLLLLWIIPVILYASAHNAQVEEHQRIFNRDWFRFQMAEAGKSMGMNLKTEKKEDYMKGPPVDLKAIGATDDSKNKANLLIARRSPGYVLVKELVADMEARHSERVMLDYSQEAVAIRHQIDGVWHNADPHDRESGDVMLAVMKQLANLNVNDRRNKQEGLFAAEYRKRKFECPIVTQGTKTGERVMVALRGGHAKDFETYADIGMRDKLSSQWSEVMNLESGVIIYSAPPEGGLSTLTDVGLLETDRLMRDFFSIEEKSNPERDIENIEPTFYDASKGESPITLLPSLSLRYPNVYVCRDWVNTESAKKLLEEVSEENRVWITSIHAKEAPEALLRMLQKKVPHKEFAESVSAVLNTRLIRKLCDACKIEYPATPDLLKKLGIPPGKVTSLYRPPKEDEIAKPCVECNGIGYKGRTGLFELLIVNEQVRQVLLKKPQMELLRKAARKAGMRTLQEEGILLVAKGETSLPELSRVLKG